MTSETAVSAKDFVDSEGRIVESAARLADEVVRLLATHEVVSINLKDVRGLSSSYFNVLLQRVIEVTTVQGFARRVKLSFDSPAQEQVFKRSLDFASRSAA